MHGATLSDGTLDSCYSLVPCISSASCILHPAHAQSDLPSGPSSSRVLLTSRPLFKILAITDVPPPRFLDHLLDLPIITLEISLSNSHPALHGTRARLAFVKESLGRTWSGRDCRRAVGFGTRRQTSRGCTITSWHVRVVSMSVQHGRR